MKLETFFKHFDLLTEAPNGVQKLRELILDLAVRGKLVPQDENDQPARELLKEIETEKKRLIKQGNIKQSKPLPEITPDEIPYNLPENWEWVKLGEIVSILGDGIHGTPIYDDQGDFFFINGNNLVDGIIEIKQNTKRVSIEEYVKHKKELNEHTVLVSINGTIGNVAFYNFEKVVLGKSACYFNLVSKIDKHYIKRLINSQYFIQYALKSATGTTIKNVSLKTMRELFVPLPPVNEQKRIVTKVDELMKLCDELEARQKKKQETRILINNAALNKLLTAETPETFTQNWQRISDNFDLLYSAPENIGKLRQAILQLAVMGKLVPQDANDEPAAALLERIKKEKERLVKEGKIKKEKLLPIPEAKEIMFDLPDIWQWERLGNALLKVTDGTHNSPPNKEKGEYKYITAKNIKQGKIDLTNITYINSEIHKEIYSRCNPELGDLLYIKDGATTGIVTINDLLEPFSMLSSVALLKLPSNIYNRYLFYVLSSPYFYSLMRNDMSGVAITRVTLAKLNKALIPIAPLNEQKRIVSKVDKLMKLCDELETKLTQTQTESEKIINAAVKQLLTV